MPLKSISTCACPRHDHMSSARAMREEEDGRKNEKNKGGLSWNLKKRFCRSSFPRMTPTSTIGLAVSEYDVSPRLRGEGEGERTRWAGGVSRFLDRRCVGDRFAAQISHSSSLPMCWVFQEMFSTAIEEVERAEGRESHWSSEPIFILDLPLPTSLSHTLSFSLSQTKLIEVKLSLNETHILPPSRGSKEVSLSLSKTKAGVRGRGRRERERERDSHGNLGIPMLLCLIHRCRALCSSAGDRVFPLPRSRRHSPRSSRMLASP